MRAPVRAAGTDSERRHVIIADAYPVVRHALRKIVMRIGNATVTEAGSFAALKTLLVHTAPDLLLLDLDMPDTEGLSGLRQLRRRYPDLTVAIVSGRSQPQVIHTALQLGAMGYIPKTLDLRKLPAALKVILMGNCWSPAPAKAGEKQTRGDPAALLARLAPQQRRVLELVAQGRLNKQIAYELGMKEATVKGHVTTILLRLGLRRRTEAALLAQRLQIS